MNGQLKIIFMGTPEFAVDSLAILVASDHLIAGVITAPDKPAGRGQIIKQSAVKEYALSKGLKIFQPTNLKDPNFIKAIKALNADLQVVVAFRMLPEVVWSMPKHGTFNLHASLLPNYRGAAPINWAIINGEKETGVTTFFINQSIDTGDILFQETTLIDSEMAAGELHDQLMNVGSKLVLKTVDAISNKDYQQLPQSNFTSIFPTSKMAPKIFKQDCQIDWTKNIKEIHNKIRGLSPYPGAWTSLKNPQNKLFNFKIYNATITSLSTSEFNGRITIEKDHFSISCNGGTIKLEVVQIAGKKKMPIEEFLRGIFIDNSWLIK